MLLNPDMPQEVYNCCSAGYITVIHHIQMDHLCAPLMQRYAIKMTYQGMVSTRGALACPFSLSPSLSLALCGWWRWCESRQMGLAARQQAVVLYVCYWALDPMYPFSSTSTYSPVLSLHPTFFTLPTFCNFLPKTSIINMFPHISPYPSISPPLAILLPSAIMAPR